MSLSTSEALSTPAVAHRLNEVKLQQYLQNTVQGFASSDRLQIQQFSHGQSNPTYLLQAGGRRYVLRKKPPGRVLASAHAVDREYQVLAALAGTPVPVPHVLCLCQDAGVIGTPFYVMEHVQGRIFLDPTLRMLSPADRAAAYRSMAHTLAALHSVDPVAVGLGKYGRQTGYCARQVWRWKQQLAQVQGEPLPQMQRLIGWLEAHIPESDTDASATRISHGDFRIDNLVYHPDTSDKVLAVLDWELSTLGHPLADLAYSAMAYHLPQGIDALPRLPRDLPPGIPTEREYVAMYCEARGIAVPDPTTLSFFLALSLFRAAAILAGVGARAQLGNASHRNAQEVGSLRVVASLAQAALDAIEGAAAAPQGVSSMSASTGSMQANAQAVFGSQAGKGRQSAHAHGMERSVAAGRSAGDSGRDLAAPRAMPSMSASTGAVKSDVGSVFSRQKAGDSAHNSARDAAVPRAMPSMSASTGAVKSDVGSVFNRQVGQPTGSGAQQAQRGAAGKECPHCMGSAPASECTCAHAQSGKSNGCKGCSKPAPDSQAQCVCSQEGQDCSTCPRCSQGGCESCGKCQSSASCGAAAPAAVGFDPPPRVQQLVAAVKRFMAEHILPAEHVLEAHSVGPNKWTIHPLVEELKTKAKAAGLWNLWLPADMARQLAHLADANEPYLLGPGLTNLEYAFISEVLGRSVWASEIFNSSAPDTGNMEVLARYGSPQQQARWLGPLLRGDIRSCFAMTEPAVASSDATNIQSSIRREVDGYVLSGRKWWASGAMDPRCAVAVFMGKTDPSAPTHKQQSMVLVPMDAPGVKIIRPLDVFGFDDAPHGHAEVLFEEVQVPAGNMLLGEGRGFEIAQGRLGPGRLHHCMRLIGMGERALELMAQRGLQRTAFKRAIAEHGAFRADLARCRVELDAARLSVLAAAHALDRDGNKKARGKIAAAKVFAPNVVLRVIDAAIQAHGGAGVSSDTPLSRLWAGARTLRIADGPDDVHLVSIAKLELARASKL